MKNGLNAASHRHTDLQQSIAAPPPAHHASHITHRLFLS
jgi:hypothetical protein